MKAVGYIRVSTEEQAQDGVSLEMQRAKIQAWCDLNDYDLTTVYTDAGLSGSKADNRPGLRAALADCEKGTALVVYSLSRLTRCLEDTLSIGNRLNRLGADLVSITEKIDTTTAAGKMVFRMLAVLSEFERDLLIERTTAALKLKKTKGELVGAVPYGFQLADDGVKLVPCAEEQVVIAQAKELHSAGLSLRKVADALAARGMFARNGEVFKPMQISRMVA